MGWFKSQGAQGRGRAIVALATGVALITSTAEGTSLTPSAGDLIAAPAKVSCIYDKLSAGDRSRYQGSLVSTKKTPRKERDALDAFLAVSANACVLQYGFSDNQFKQSGSYLAGRLIFESKVADLDPVMQAKIPAMFHEMPGPLIAGWASGHNEVEKKYQAFFGNFMQKYKLDYKTTQKILDILNCAAVIREAINQFDRA